MIKAVIAEDKPPILWSIKQKIENYSKADIKVVGEAHNGREALSLIKELKPDVVFTDIRMPVMDGLELISELKHTHPDIHFIIISGYDEFEYARRAMRLGVTEYVLKPVTQDVIDEILDKTVIAINEKAAIAEKNQIRGILNSASAVKQTDYAFQYRYFSVALICAGSYSSQMTDYTNPFAFFGSRVDFSGLIKNQLPANTYFWCFEGKNLNEMILVLGFTECPAPGMNRMMASISDALLAEGFPVTLAVGRIINHINEIGMEAQNARVLLRKHLIFGKPAVIYPDTPATAEKEPALDSSTESKLLSFIQNNQKNLFLNEIKRIVDYFSQYGFTQHNIEITLKYIAYICSKVVIDRNDFTHSLELDIEEVLSITNDYSSLLQGLHSIFSQFFSSTNDAKQKREPLKQIIDEVVKYITVNFSKQITINDIAVMVKVDPCHLSKTFKGVIGVSPMEYLTKLRIEKSKELMNSNQDIMLKDIADIVGYTNQYYFSRIFKVVTGLTPSEYKEASKNISHFI